jgi:hypothetical protein
VGVAEEAVDDRADVGPLARPLLDLDQVLPVGGQVIAGLGDEEGKVFREFQGALPGRP